MINAVLFDLFETIVTEVEVHPTRASSLGERLGLVPEEFRREWKIRRPRVVVGQLSFADALAEICRALAGRVDMVTVQQLREERIRQKAAVFAAISEEVSTLIATLADRGIGLGVISNCFPEDVQAWPACPLAPRFQCNVFSFAEGVAKPAGEIYERAVGRLGVAPAATVFIGDGGDTELAGAEQAGLRAFRATWFRSRWPVFRATVTGRDVASVEDVLRLVEAG